MAEFNDFDLELIQFLDYFEKPENEAKYKNTFIDDDFNEFWDNYEEMSPDEGVDNDVDVENEDEWVEVENE